MHASPLRENYTVHHGSSRSAVASGVPGREISHGEQDYCELSNSAACTADLSTANCPSTQGVRRWILWA